MPKTQVRPRPKSGEPGLSYLCEGYAAFYRHVAPYMRAMIQLIENGLPAEYIMKAVTARWWFTQTNSRLHYLATKSLPETYCPNVTVLA